MSILIVDDTASQRFLLSAILKAAGYANLITASSAMEAFERLGMNDSGTLSSAVDLILMDISMPQIDGLEACRRIKADLAAQDIPIIMITASTDEADLQLAFDAGAMDYLNKPPNKTELLARVRSALRLKHEMDSRKAREIDLRQLNQKLELAFASLQEEQAKSEQLLLNILPGPIANRLKLKSDVIADSFPEVTVLFADIVDFTRLSASVSPNEVVTLLNSIFSRFDELAEKHGLEKIKTIGDSYMAVGGLPTPNAQHAEAVAEMALDMRGTLSGRIRSTGSLVTVRIGIHTGPVVAGVIGQKKFSYDLWGDTVNIASRMESLCVNGRIQISAETHKRLKDKYTFEERGLVQVKGWGEMLTYFLTGRQ